MVTDTELITWSGAGYVRPEFEIKSAVKKTILKPILSLTKVLMSDTDYKLSGAFIISPNEAVQCRM